MAVPSILGPVSEPPTRYRSPDEDSARWLGFSFRAGDIVISTRSKHGTTWMQMICALLVFQTADVPAPLAQLSPWLDWLGVPRQQLFAQLEAQRHRRFLKTHTPLDGVPLDPRVMYIVVARDPLDAAVSLYYQGCNLDFERLAHLTGAPTRDGSQERRPPPREWLQSWIDGEADPREELDSLPGVMWHLSDAWARRSAGNVVLVHYDDLLADLEREMRRLAERLGITVEPGTWPSLVAAADFRAMRDRAAQLAPDPGGVLKDRLAFFRRGRSGAGRELLSSAQVTRYTTRCADMAPPGLLRWLHRSYSP
jgi:aryl sulfotransferase